MWTVLNRAQSCVEHIVSVRDGLQHPVWGKVFGHKFRNRNHLTPDPCDVPVESAKIKSFQPKTVDEQAGDEDDERNSDLEAPSKHVAWYHPARICG